jgi:hypothetical protein
MSANIENIELGKFYTTWMQDIDLQQRTDEEGSTSEQIFTQSALDLLAEAGEVENFRTSYDEKALGTPKQHKINAYAISENYETVDLFITIFKGTSDISKTSADEIKQAATRITNFFRKAIYANDYEKSKSYRTDYVDEIEETSEIFQFANTLAKEMDLRDNLVRVNATILSNGVYSGEFPLTVEISGYKIYFKVFDLQALYNISEKSHIPVEINFYADGFEVPCIGSPVVNSEYQSYLAIIPATALASIYERFGSRLLEQNVRSFLQFTGKINKGIRSTIKDEPHMFLAFNNGIAATADEVEFVKSPDGNGVLISNVKDLQIVNGGQTTASIYHTWKKDKADISNIFVQIKLTVIKNKDNFSSIVSRISEYANTQNKVSVADLSSNRPYHIDLEKLSRSIYTPLSESSTYQTRWFYERARGQYKNARLKDGFTKSRQKAFDLKNPKLQMFTKEELAKYLNAYEEIVSGSKILIGPHYVVRGSQKNYVQFINYNLPKKIDNVYFEDSVAKGIVFKAAEKVYGVKPNAIGDMRYITVPYSISLLTYLTKNQIDLYRIWRNQTVSENLKSLFFEMMKEVETLIKSSAPGGLYGEWAKKEECWVQLKNHSFGFDLNRIKDDLTDKNKIIKRQVINDDETSKIQIEEEILKLKSIPFTIWKKIEEFGYETKILSDYQNAIAYKISGIVKKNGDLSEIQRTNGIKILDIIIDKAPELLFEIDDLLDNGENQKSKDPEITMEFIQSMVSWDRQRKRLKPYQFKTMFDIVNGKEQLTPQNAKYCLFNYYTLYKYGYRWSGK